MKTPSLISLHGGHSGQFCNHAEDTLEEMIRAYIDRGFKSVGISEHMPPFGDEFLYPDEIEAGLTAKGLQKRFALYFEELERLKEKYRKEIIIYKGFETETRTGYQDQVKTLVNRYRPDYIVGSVHHVNDGCFDYSQEVYDRICKDLGSVDAVYLAYFDAQFEMIRTIRPFVVGHFDLIRIFDPAFMSRLETPGILAKIKRNLSLVKDLGLALDYNLRPLSRGEDAPYLAPGILDMAREMEIPVIPGDDSHSSVQAGKFVDRAVRTLEEMGFSTDWPVPRCLPVADI